MTEVLTIDEIEARISGAIPIGAARQPKDAGLWARHPDDYYVEPEWTSARLFETVQFDGTIVDPACGSGRIVRAARNARGNGLLPGGTRVLGYDIVKRCRECHEDLEDFLASDYETDNIVSNPPFGLCNLASKKSKNTRHFEFVEKALDTAEKKVALLLPFAWLTGAKKAEFLQTTPLSRVLILTPRPSMPPGPVIEAGEEPGGGEDDFAWMIWERGYEGEPTLGWLNRDA